MNIYVSNISFHTTEEILTEMFSIHGAVSRVTIVRDMQGGIKPAFGFVEMLSAEAAYEAIDKLDGREIQGRSLRVSLAKNRYPGKESRSAPLRKR